MTAAAVALLVAVLAAFTGLDGIGRGAVLRAVTGRSAQPREEVFAGVGPQLLGSHVWLVAAAGLLYGLLGRWEVAVVSHAYWWVLAVTAGLVLRIAALDFRRKGGRPVWEVTAAVGVLATGAGTGGFLATAAGVWPVLGAVAVVALDRLLGGWWSDRTVALGPLVTAGIALSAPAVLLAVDGAWPGALVVAALVVIGVALALRRGAPPIAAGVALVLAVAALPMARLPQLAVPGAEPSPVGDLIAGPVTVSLVVGAAGPVFLLVLAVQAWFWRSLARRPAAVYY